MAHFRKSHVSVFVARRTLTRGRSPNTESIKRKPENTLDTLYSTATSINAETEEVGKISRGDDEEMFCHLKSAVERKRVCV